MVIGLGYPSLEDNGCIWKKHNTHAVATTMKLCLLIDPHK